MADFKQAIEWMKQGKKVKRKIMTEDFYLFIDRQLRIRQSSEGFTDIHSNDYIPNLEAIDWEILQEQETLSDAICNCWDGPPHLPIESVKNFIKELIDKEMDLRDLGLTYDQGVMVCNKINEFIKKEAGDKLI